MTFIEIRVLALVGNDRPRTKRALRLAVETAPGSVRFESLSADGLRYDGTLTDLPEGVTLLVIGPDPRTDRRWFASISVFDGKYVVT